MNRTNNSTRKLPLESSIGKMGSIDPKKMARRGSYQNIDLEEIEALAKQ